MLPILLAAALGGICPRAALSASSAGNLKAFPPQLSRLPIARPPRIALQGKTVEARHAEVEAWFKEHYKTRCQAGTYIFYGLVRHLAESIVFDVKGRQRIHPEIWDKALENYNGCIRLLGDIKACAAPDEFKNYLARHCVDTVLLRAAELDRAGFKKMLAGIPAGSTVVRVAKGGTLAPYIAGVDVRFAKRPALARKVVFDALSELNPNLRPEGCYVSKALFKEPLDQVGIHLGSKVFQMFRYRVLNPADPILLPPAARIAELAACRAVDLRDLHVSDLSLLGGLKPEELDISHTGIRDITPLSSLAGLKRLRIRGLGLNSLAPLKGLRLESLDASHNSISDLSPLKGMPLEELDITGTVAGDLRPLTGMPLKKLELAGTPVLDLSPLSGMKLTDVVLSRRPFKGLDAIKNMSSLPRVSDYDPTDWFNAASTNEAWIEPGTLILDNMKGGGKMLFTFDSADRRDHACDYMRFNLEFDKTGRLARSFVTQPPELNIIQMFRPTRWAVEGKKVKARAVVTIAKYTTKQDYEFDIDCEVGRDAIKGKFHMRYEQEVFDPHGGYYVIVYNVDGTTSGTISHREPRDRKTDPIAPDKIWPGWRGPSGNGEAATDGHELVEVLGSAKLAWISQEDLPGSHEPDLRKTKQKNASLISGGYSGPIVYDGRVYLYYYMPNGEEFDEKIAGFQTKLNGYGREKWYIDADDVILCVDGRTGRTVWKQVFERKGVNLNSFNAGEPQPLLTPYADNGTIYAMGTGGRVYAVDAKTGALNWESHLGYRWETQERVRSAAADERRMPKFRRDFGTTPVVAAGVVVCCDHSEYFGGQRTYFSGMVGFDARSGRRLWTLEDICGMTASPVRWVHAGREYVLASSDEISCIDPRTGKIVWQLPGAEFPVAPGLKGDILVCNRAGKDGLCGYRLGPTGAAKLWSAGRAQVLSTCPPAVVGNRLYTVGAKALNCIDVATGKVLASFDTEYVPAGLVGYRNRLLVEGMQLFDLGGEEALSSPSLWAPPHARGTTPAIADGRLFFRGPSALFCYDLRKAAADAGDLEELEEMILGSMRGLQYSSMKALCLQRGKAGQDVVRRLLKESLTQKDSKTFRKLLGLMRDEKVTIAMRKDINAAIMVALNKQDAAFTPVAIDRVPSMVMTDRLKTEPILLKLLAKADFAAQFSKIYLALDSMDARKGRALDVSVAVAPHTGHKDKRTRGAAIYLLESTWRRTKSKELDDTLAKALLQGWQYDRLSEESACLAFIIRMKTRAAVIDPEVRKWVMDPKRAKAARRVLRTISPNKSIRIGPKLPDASKKVKEDTLDDLLGD